jgi:hypothetical protein
MSQIICDAVTDEQYMLCEYINLWTTYGSMPVYRKQNWGSVRLPAILLTKNINAFIPFEPNKGVGILLGPLQGLDVF